MRFRLEGGGKYVDLEIESYDQMTEYVKFAGQLLWDELHPQEVVARTAAMKAQLKEAMKHITPRKFDA